MLGAKRKGDVQVPPIPSSTLENGGVIVGGNGGAQLAAENGNAVVVDPPPVDQTPARESVKKLRRTTAKPASYGCISSGSDDDFVDDEDSENEEQSEEEQELEAEIEAGNEAVDGEGEGEEEEEEDEEDEESIDKPKLAEGFYLIEAVRGKRIRRGKREYRIKWRGWPESENTWEPMENLKTVPHVIAAYEESLRVKRSRKRKRKNSYSFSQTKKRTQRRSVSAAAPPLKIAEEAIPAVTVTADAETADNVDLNSGFVDDTEMPDIEVGGEKSNENGVDLVSPEGNEGVEIGDDDVGQAQVEPQEAKLAEEKAVANGSVRTEAVEEEVLVEAGRGTSTGARKRKSGPVRRFKFYTNNSSDDIADDVENHGLNNGVFTGLNGDQLPGNLDSTSKDVRTNVRANICDIIEIVKPVKFSTYKANNSVEVCLNFIVRKSDGNTMTVDNKYLKAHCPVMLVNYYEQRIRY